MELRCAKARFCLREKFYKRVQKDLRAFWEPCIKGTPFYNRGNSPAEALPALGGRSEFAETGVALLHQSVGGQFALRLKKCRDLLL